MAGVLVAALPVLAATQSGTAKDDLLGLSLFTAAAAFVLSVPREPRLHVMAGVASGVALGTKLSFPPPVAALAVSSIAIGPVRKASAAWMWTTGILATGSFWYFRNWFQAGSPLPLLHLGALGLPGAKVPSLEANKQSVAHYLFDGAIWKHAFLPGIRSAIGIGAIWPVVPLIAAAGTVLALMRGDRLERALGLTAFVSAVAYVFLPQSAGGPEGHPYLFGGGLRYVTPALTLGVLLAAVMTWRLTTRRTVHIGLAATMGTIAIASAVSSPGSSSRYTAVAAIVACVALLPLAFSKWARQIAIVLVGCTLIFGWPLARHYLLLRYSIGPYFQPLQPIFVWSQTVRNSRIAIAGFQEHYPLYGPDGSNRVEYLGVRAPNGTFRPPANCREWSRALHRGHYDYLVLTTYLFPFAPRVPSPAFHWTAYPRIARQYTNRAPGTAIFRLDRRGGVVACR